MAQAVRFGIFLLSLVLAGLAFFSQDPSWEWIAPLVILVLGSALAEFAFNRLATLDEKQRDLNDRTRNPPA